MTSIVDVCGFVDELGDEAVGELLFASSDAVQGSAFIERGRICWAAARGMAKRLTELLARPAGLDAPAMERLYVTCKEAHHPLGEYLVARGLLAPESLRSALLRHTIESLHRLCAAGARPGFRPRGAGGYSPRFTFTTTEVLVVMLAESHSKCARRMHEELHEIFRDEEWGAAFLRSGQRSAPEPVAVHGEPPASATMLLRAGKWAASALDVASPVEHRERMVACTVGRDTMVAWESEGTIFCGRTGVHGPARILHRRARARHVGGQGHGGL